jgi:hypothetical protein
MLNFGASLIDMDEQWKHEIDIFFRRLRNNDVEVIDGSIYAVYDERNNDGRCIVYEPGAMRLRDDYYSMQHSRQLTDRELGRIHRFLARHGENFY